ncbi:MAG TPA: sugar transferase [Ferruginibacter sp.]|jgi:putative colanic acid biosynthesis UDP-glucose lipid carrier transferase|nr:sugar transferase [Ferruginibacter sp.]
MRKKITPVNKLYEFADLSIIKEDAPGAENFFYPSSYKELTGFINVKTITTPLLYQPLDDTHNKILKRCFDIILSIIIIIGILSWLMPIIALAIWIDSRGPIFFLQKRNKRGEELFTCIKFRSMVVNADADILPAGRNDKRITAIGTFLRNHYIDELPQFFNVLIGDMSIIGPRPHMVSDNIKYEKEIDHYNYRHKGKPGITGLAQVLGYVGTATNVQEIKDRVGLDIFYLRHWSLRLDIIILYRTFCKIINLPLR